MRLLKFISADSAWFALAVLASFVSGITTMGVLVVTFHLIRGADHSRDLLGAFAVLAILAVASRGVARSLLEKASGNAVYAMRTRLAARMVAAPLIELERIGVSRLTTALTDDVSKVAGSMPHVTAFCTHLTFLLASFAYLGWLSPKKLLVTMLVVGVGMLLHQFLQRRAVGYLRASRGKWDEMTRSLRRLTDGFKELKLNAARRAESLDAFSSRVADLRSSTRTHSTAFGQAVSAMQLIFFLALGLASFNFDGSLDDRDLVLAYSVVIIWMMIPLQGIAAAWQGLSEASVSLGRLDETGLKLDALEEQTRGSREKVLPALKPQWRQLELRGLTHKYGAGAAREEFVLGPIDLSLVRGELMFVVGGNGSGKTTFAKLLVGLYSPSNGEIRLDGEPITDCNRDEFRQNFSAIFSDFFLFDRLLAHGGGEEERAIKLLDRLKMKERVRLENGRLSTTTALSLGERKRLGLLFSCLEDRPVYVFDEWAADQDPVFKNIFYREILPDLKARGKLVVVISHDDRYFDVADLILVLERGMPPILERPQTGVHSRSDTAVAAS